MKEQVIKDIEQKMSSILNNEQMKKLSEVLTYVFYDIEITNRDESKEDAKDYLVLFLSSKRIEGCSEKSLTYYKSTIEKMTNTINKRVNLIETEDLRRYLSEYQEKANAVKPQLTMLEEYYQVIFLGLKMKITLLKIL